MERTERYQLVDVNEAIYVGTVSVVAGSEVYGQNIKNRTEGSACI